MHKILASLRTNDTRAVCAVALEDNLILINYIQDFNQEANIKMHVERFAFYMGIEAVIGMAAFGAASCHDNQSGSAGVRWGLDDQAAAVGIITGENLGGLAFLEPILR